MDSLQRPPEECVGFCGKPDRSKLQIIELSTVLTPHLELRPERKPLVRFQDLQTAPLSLLLIGTSAYRLKFSIARNIHYKKDVAYGDKSALIHCSILTSCFALY